MNMTTECSLSTFSEEMTELEIKQGVADAVLYAQSLEVVDAEGYGRVTRLYREAKDWKKGVEARRKHLVEPHRSTIAQINDRARELSDPLDRIIDIANLKSSLYTKQLEEEKRQADAKLLDMAAIFDCEEEIYIEPAPSTLRGDGAMSVTKTETKFKLEDLSKVPLRYLQLNEKAVQLDIKLGVMEIEGICIYQEKSTQLRVR